MACTHFLCQSAVSNTRVWAASTTAVHYCLIVLEPAGQGQGVLGWSFLHCPLSIFSQSSLCVCVLICPYSSVMVKLSCAPADDHIYLSCLCKSPVPNMVMLVGVLQWSLDILC